MLDTSEIKELYQEVILDHNRNPRNFGEIENYTHHARGHNPLCGDQLDLFLIIENDVIQEVKFKGSGCAISKASASIMTTILKGKTANEAKKIFDEFHKIITVNSDNSNENINIGKLAVFAGVREFPARVKCASLAWHTLLNALENSSNNVTTE
ncbi:MAG: SUF system NifU family Fe-S cluster assembly protein [Ignavibacteria bacterium]|jgi:nitrogen fixation NifU-like protein|nr:SUF system NifU family Fe-S cluster assembly protein [Ignavibacteria bacterium]